MASNDDRLHYIANRQSSKSAHELGGNRTKKKAGQRLYYGDNLSSFTPGQTSITTQGPVNPNTPSTHNLPPVQWLSQQIEAWFGSMERFEDNVVLVSKVVLVDCLTYPFVVFSRQCQFYPYNITRFSVAAPFSTIVVLNHILNSQGASALWRGWRSHVILFLLLRPFMNALLQRLVKRTGAAKSSFNPKYWLTTVFFQSLPHLVTMPLLSYTYREMVETTLDKANEGMTEVALDRPFYTIDEYRRLPFITLATPTVLHGLLSNIVSYLIKRVIKRLFPTHYINRTSSRRQYFLTSSVRALWLDYFSLLLTDILLYPLETVLVRLYCQGMPALVDNIQSGIDVEYISLYYGGVVDCMNGIWDSEGALGFFKGFSSLLVRYAIHGAVLLVVWRTVHVLENRLNNR